MTTKTKSPFAQQFIAAIQRGTPCWNAVQMIAFKSKKTPTVVFNSLCKAGLCFRQKINSQWIYWPCQVPRKGNTKQIKSCQANMWQWYVEWCLANGFCTPSALHRHTGPETKFMNWCNKYWFKQFGGLTAGTFATPATRSKPKTRKTKPRKPKAKTYKSKVHKPKKRKSTAKRRKSSRSGFGASTYKFSSFKFPKYRKVA